MTNYTFCYAKSTGWETNKSGYGYSTYEPDNPPVDPDLENLYTEWNLRAHSNQGDPTYFERALNTEKVREYIRNLKKAMETHTQYP